MRGKEFACQTKVDGNSINMLLGGMSEPPCRMRLQRHSFALDDAALEVATGL